MSNSIVISNVDDDLQRRLNARAAEHGHSVETEAREILRSALPGGQPNRR